MANVARAAERLRLARLAHAQGQLEEAAVRQTVGAWVAHARHADTFALRRQWFPGGWFSPLGEAARAR